MLVEEGDLPNGVEAQDWYVIRRDKRYGPLALFDLIDAISAGAIKKNDLIWQVGWRDWRLAGSPDGPLAQFFGGSVDFGGVSTEEFAPKRRNLVDKFDLKIRRLSPKRVSFSSIFSRYDAARIYGSICLFLPLAIIAGLSFIIFGDIRYGVPFILIEFAILMTICMRVIKRRDPVFRFATPSAVASLLLIAMNWQFFPEALDAWQAKRHLRNLTRSDQIEHLATEYPSNKFIKLVAGFNDAIQQSKAEVKQLIEDFEPQKVTFDTLASAPNRDALIELTNGLRAAEARTTLGITKYRGIMEREKLSFEKTASQIYASDPLRLLPALLEVARKSRETRYINVEKELGTLGSFYSSMGDLAEFLALHFDQIQRSRPSKGNLVSADQTVSAKYTKLLSSVRNAKAQVAAIEKANRAFDTNNQRKLWIEIASIR